MPVSTLRCTPDSRRAAGGRPPRAAAIPAGGVHGGLRDGAATSRVQLGRRRLGRAPGSGPRCPASRSADALLRRGRRTSPSAPASSAARRPAPRRGRSRRPSRPPTRSAGADDSAQHADVGANGVQVDLDPRPARGSATAITSAVQHARGAARADRRPPGLWPGRARPPRRGSTPRPPRPRTAATPLGEQRADDARTARRRYRPSPGARRPSVDEQRPALAARPRPWSGPSAARRRRSPRPAARAAAIRSASRRRAGQQARTRRRGG